MGGPDRTEQMTAEEMHLLSRAEAKVNAELKEEGVRKNDSLLEALKLLDHLEGQKARLEAREQYKRRTKFSEWLADKIAEFGGSWRFIIIFLSLMATWMAINILWLVLQWDPYPFILLNLMLSTLAALQAPIILMSQNRQAQRDRYRDEIDFERDRLDLKVDTLAAKTIREATVRIAHIEQQMVEMNKKLDTLMAKKVRKR